MKYRIYLSPPHMTGRELSLVEEAFRSNWIAPLGPMVDGFEAEFREAVGAKHALALSSGTAAIHLALLAMGIGPGDEVLVSSFTFSASVNPIVYVGARPVLIDSERRSWNMDPDLLNDALSSRARSGRLPKAVIVVDLYGQTADMTAIVDVCDRYGVPLVEDAAEALGSTHGKQSAGTFGKAGVFSFNGNKIITTSGGGMLVSDDGALVQHARKLSTQAREPAPHYEHTEIGYNYRLSNVLAAIGREQLRALPSRVEARRGNFRRYQEKLAGAPVSFMPEPDWGRSNRWLTCITIADESPVRPDAVLRALADRGIEGRPLWKPMHLQPVFQACERHGGSVSAHLFERGLCLPSGSTLADDEIDEIADIVGQTVCA